MAKFTYVAKDGEAHTVKGDMQAHDKKQALDTLRAKGFLVLKLEKSKAAGGLFSSFKLTRGVKVSLDELVVITRQMATMIESGITVVSMLDILAEQTDKADLRKTLRDIRDSVKTGASLSDALSRHMSLFSSLFVNMVRAGESSGTLDSVLERVATYMEKTNALQRKIKAALVYPIVVTAMAILITLVLILRVIPVIKDIYDGFGAKLPGPTQFLIDLSDWMRDYFWLLSCVVIIMFFVLRWYVTTDKGKFAVDNVKLKLPIFGPLIKKVAISRFTRTLSTLVKSGVPILTALEIVAKTSGNVVVEDSVNSVRESVQRGESIADPMEKSGIFPPLVSRMVAVGEKSGELEKMLTKISDFFDEQVDAAVSGLTSLIEPLIIAFLGLVIGGVVLCMFLPIFKISSIVNF